MVNMFNEKLRAEKNEKIGEHFDWREEKRLIGSDVVSMFPSLSKENTALAVRRQAQKSPIIWKNIDKEWLGLYIHLNRENVSDLDGMEKFLPYRRPGRKGTEAGLGSIECREKC